MPTYEYACKECGEHLELVQSFKDAALTECGRCGGELRKVFSAAGIIFKGSGYYVTDSRSKPADGDSPAKSDTKSDAKSATSSGSDSSAKTNTTSTDSSSSSGSGTAKSA